jgi:tryprostatin B 6-hydroxylase
VESAFPNSNVFVPERWTTSPELLKNKAAFVPFSTGMSPVQLSPPLYHAEFSQIIGTYSCVGKQLALLSLRTVVARLVQHFDIKFADGETGEGLLRDTRDVFTLEIAPLYLMFTRR